jgi:hypothetical protein
MITSSTCFAFTTLKGGKQVRTQAQKHTGRAACLCDCDEKEQKNRITGFGMIALMMRVRVPPLPVFERKAKNAKRTVNKDRYAH